ncbi:MAG: phosphoribosyltransferase family protein [Patescibacteria group bacterium]|nr:phosphoribosyltransferase family protein [Patescibacteria group bacterium]
MLLISNTTKGKRLAKKLRFSFVLLEKKVYPDGEVALKLSGETRNVKKIIYWQFSSEDNFDAEIINLLSLLYYLNDKKQTGLILSYLPYARSLPLRMEYEVDKLGCFLEKIAPYIGQIFFIKPHCKPEILKKYLKGVKIGCIDLENIVAEFIGKRYKNYILVSPDKGFSGYAKKLAMINKKNYIILKKKRLTPEKVKVESYSRIPKEDLGKDFIIVDDITSTGGTLLDTAKHLKDGGARKIACLVIHNLLKDKRIEARFRKQKIKLFYTDSLGYEDAPIDVAGGIYKFLRNKNYG